MATKAASKKAQSLGFVDIVLGCDAETIRAAYEARVKIDKLLIERDEAYRRIVEIETAVEEIVGEQGVYPFPPPPFPVAGLSGGAILMRQAQPNQPKSGRHQEVTAEETEDLSTVSEAEDSAVSAAETLSENAAESSEQQQN